MTFFRNTVWFLKGLKEYTNGGYARASKSFVEADLQVDCSGRNYMITGANSGIGICMALEVAKRGGTVHLVCRNPTTAEEAKKNIIEASNNENVFVHILDLSDSKGVQSFATNFCTSNEALHGLINNAGCMINTRELNESGLEKNFVTNTLGTYILTTRLLPLLSKTEESRVVTVSSGGMLVKKLDVSDFQFEKMNPFDGTMAYAQNKRQQVVMTEQWAAQHPEVHFSVMHPGWADTPAVRTSMPEFHAKMKDRLRTPEQGADTAVWLIVSPAALQQPSGLFFQDRQPVSTHLPLACTRVDAKDEQQLMATLEELAQKYQA